MKFNYNRLLVLTVSEEMHAKLAQNYKNSKANSTTRSISHIVYLIVGGSCYVALDPFHCAHYQVHGHTNHMHPA